MTTDRSRHDLRRRMREHRNALSPAQRIAAASGLVESLQRLPEFMVDNHVAGYWAVGGEVPLHAAVANLRSRAQQYYLPIIGQGHVLRFASLLPNAAVRANRYGIPEPEHADADALQPNQIDLALVPLTAFDRRGHRLGTGGGYYDRSFSFLKHAARPAQPLLVGIGYSFQEVAELPADDWDVPMDFIATELELIDCLPPEANA